MDHLMKGQMAHTPKSVGVPNEALFGLAIIMFAGVLLALAVLVGR